MESESQGKHPHASCMDTPCTEPGQADQRADHGHEHPGDHHDEHGHCHADD